jgi:hypothetical protein
MDGRPTFMMRRYRLSGRGCRRVGDMEVEGDGEGEGEGEAAAAPSAAVEKRRRRSRYMVARRSGGFVRAARERGFRGKGKKGSQRELGRNGQKPKDPTGYGKASAKPPRATPFAMASLFAAGRRLLSLGRRGVLLPVPRSRAVATSSRSNSEEERPPQSLQSTLWPLGHPCTLLVPEIELWAARPRNRLRAVELQRIVRELRKRHRHRQALEVNTVLLLSFLGCLLWGLAHGRYSMK